ncbi:MFS transporter [Thiotrichales bacterium 19X7-9]|nr:MFS transporter [Thiotrichales bacterium 19X7-9]
MNNIWKNHQFSRFFVSFTIGNIGDWFDIFALQIIFVIEWHASPVLLGLMILFYFLPSIILSPFAGVLTDKVSKRNMMIITDLIAGFLTIGLYFSNSILFALVLIFVRASVVCFNVPAQQAYIKHVVSQKQLLKASSYTTVVFQMCKVIGPMLGALVMVIASARSCLAINAVSFIISALILFGLPFDKPLKSDENDQEEIVQSWISDVLSGLKLVWKNQLVRTVVILVMIWFFCSLVRQAQLAIFIHHVLPNEPEALGIFVGLDGLGAVITSVLISRKENITNYSSYFIIGFIILGCGVLGLSLYQSSWPSWGIYIFGFVIGLGTGTQLVTYGYLIKKETPEHQMGRVSGAASTMQNTALALGTLSSGFLVLHLGIREVYFLLSIVLFTLSICSYIFLKRILKS